MTLEEIDSLTKQPMTNDEALDHFANLARDYGAQLVLEIDNDLDATATIYAGDTNCTHAKPYDPIDGHGFTEAGTDDGNFIELTSGKSFTIAQAIYLSVVMFQDVYKKAGASW
jgi:hypothetical protein